jgi:hypothetical protein
MLVDGEGLLVAGICFRWLASRLVSFRQAERSLLVLGVEFEGQLQVRHGFFGPSGVDEVHSEAPLGEPAVQITFSRRSENLFGPVELALEFQGLSEGHLCAAYRNS